jgi:hypothetical protein
VSFRASSAKNFTRSPPAATSSTASCSPRVVAAASDSRRHRPRARGVRTALARVTAARPSPARDTASARGLGLRDVVACSHRHRWPRSQAARANVQVLATATGCPRCRPRAARWPRATRLQGAHLHGRHEGEERDGKARVHEGKLLGWIHAAYDDHGQPVRRVAVPDVGGSVSPPGRD